jgi:CRP/FNR family transcriptional regulator
VIAHESGVMKTTSEIISHSPSSNGGQDFTSESYSAPSGLADAAFFSDLPEDDLNGLSAMRRVRSFAKRSTIFMQGAAPTGVFVLSRGKVKLTACSAGGKTIILHIAGEGEVLGLSAVVGSTDHETSAVALDDCEMVFFQSADFLRLLAGSPAACLSAARHLARNCHAAYTQICSLGLSDSVFDKVGELLLSWAASNSEAKTALIENFLTHEEIAGMIGSSRETVTRTLRTFRERGLITINGRELVIEDLGRLRSSIRGFA